MNKRVLKTKKEIRTAFVKLLSEKEIEKLTVKEIAETAQVDRKTVYNYYKGVEEILEELENELMASFERSAKAYVNENTQPKDLFKALVHFLNENFEICNLLMHAHNNERLLNKMVVFLRGQIRSSLKKNPLLSPEKIDLVAEYATGGVFCAYRAWFLSENRKPLEEFSEDVASICMFGVPAYLLSL